MPNYCNNSETFQTASNKSSPKGFPSKKYGEAGDMKSLYIVVGVLRKPATQQSKLFYFFFIFSLSFRKTELCLKLNSINPIGKSTNTMYSLKVNLIDETPTINEKHPKYA